MRSVPLAVFGNAITCAERVLPRQQHHHAVEPERDPAVGRRAVARAPRGRSRSAPAPPRATAPGARTPSPAAPSRGSGCCRRRPRSRSARGRRPSRAPCPGRSRGGRGPRRRATVNGWCRLDQRLPSLSHSKSGNSVTHRKRKAFSSTSFSSRPSSRRRMPIAIATAPGLSTPIRTVSSFCAPTFSNSLRATSGEAPFSLSLASWSSVAFSVQQVALLGARVGHDARQPQLLVDLAQPRAGDAGRGRQHDRARAGARLEQRREDVEPEHPRARRSRR